MDQAQIDQEVLKYETLINEKLRRDLQLIQDRLNQIMVQLRTYEEIKCFVQSVQDKAFGDGPLRAQFDLGCNFYARCTIPSTDKIVIFAGLDTYVQLDMDEAVEFIDKRCQLLNGCIDVCERQASYVKATIKVLLDTLRDLQGITDTSQQ